LSRCSPLRSTRACSAQTAKYGACTHLRQTRRRSHRWPTSGPRKCPSPRSERRARRRSTPRARAGRSPARRAGR